MKILLVTACGERQENFPCPAYRLYKSARIKAVYKRKGDCDFCILSGKYGLLEPDRVIGPYGDVMSPEKVKELLPQVINKVKDYDVVLYFKAGARSAYLDCIRPACQKANKTLIITGFAHMGGINNLPKIINLVKRRNFKNINKLPYTEITKC